MHKVTLELLVVPEMKHTHTHTHINTQTHTHTHTHTNRIMGIHERDIGANCSQWSMLEQITQCKKFMCYRYLPNPYFMKVYLPLGFSQKI